MSDSEYSDVSLDEEDEEVIWRAFFGDEDTYEANDVSDTSVTSASPDEFASLSQSELEAIDPVLAARYQHLSKNEPDRQLTEADKKQLLSQNLSAEQMARFEAYREMKLNRPGVKKICNGVLGHSIPNNIAVILSAVSKSFLGEIITRAMDIQRREAKGRLVQQVQEKKHTKAAALKRISEGEDGVEVEEHPLEFDDSPATLQPYHIREAWRLYQLESSSAIAPQWRYQGDGDGKMFRG